MASPQLENGYVKIANELLGALMRLPLSNYEMRVVLCVIEKTYGWNKKKDWISLSQFEADTCIKNAHVCRTLNVLVDKKILTKTGSKYHPYYSLQKDYDEWSTLPIQGVPIQAINTPYPGNQVLPNQGDTQDTIPKTLLQKREAKRKIMEKEFKKRVGGTMTAKDMNNIYRVVEAFKPVNKFWHTLEDNPKQMDAAWRMIQVAGVDSVLKVIAILPETNKIPYVANISSPVKLEEKWSDLEAQLRKRKAGAEEIRNKKTKVRFS